MKTQTFAVSLPYRGANMTMSNAEFMLATEVLHNAAKRGCDYYDVVNKIENCVKTRHHAIPASKFITENTPVRDVASSYDRRADSPCCCKCRSAFCCSGDKVVRNLKYA